MTDHEYAMLSALSERLLRNVYYAVTLLVVMGSKGQIIGLWQYDTVFCTPPAMDAQTVQSIWLVSNHPDGNKDPLAQDENSLRILRGANPDLPCSLALYSEDEGLHACGL